MTRSLPGVSVVIPAYNSAWSIERTIASVLAQTRRDFEVIVVNDGSTDALESAVGRVSAGDERVRIVQQENRGLAGARNRGIAESRAPYVAPLDADDVWEPEYLQATTDALDQHADAPFAFTYHYRMDEHDQRLPTPEYAHAPRHDFLGLLSVNSVGCGSAAVFRRDAVLAAGGYDETLRARAGQGAEDLKLILQLAATGQPRLIERDLVGYRHVSAGMSIGNPEGQLASMMAVFEDLRQLFPATPARALANARTMAIIWLLPALLRQKRFGRALKLGVQAYVLNPTWIADANIRDVHLAWVRGLLRRLS